MKKIGFAACLAVFTFVSGCCDHPEPGPAPTPTPEPTSTGTKTSTGSSMSEPAPLEDAGACVPPKYSYWTDGTNACETCTCPGQLCHVGTVSHDGILNWSEMQGICSADLNCSLKCPSLFDPPWCMNGVQDHGEVGVDCGGVAGCKACP